MRKIAGITAGVLIAAVVGGFFSGGANAAANDLIVTGPGTGGGANVRTFGPDGKDGGTNYFSSGNSTSGARVAAGDITGDGVSEIVTGTGPGVGSLVQVWSGDGATLIAQISPFGTFQGGVFVAAANEDESNALEIIVSAGAGGGPHVKVYRLFQGQLQELYSFFAYHAGFSGGVHVAASGGRIITAPGAGGGPHVKVFRIFIGELSVENEWMAYEPRFTGGVYVAAGNVRSATTTDVVTGAGPGGGPHVKLFSLEGAEGPGVMAYAPSFTGGVRVGVGMGRHLITGAGPGGGPHVITRTVNSNGVFTVVASLMAYAADFRGGIFVGGFLTSPLPPTTTTSCAIPGLFCSGETTTTTSTTTTTVPTTSTTTTTVPTTTTSTSTTTSTTTTTTSTSTTTTTVV